MDTLDTQLLIRMSKNLRKSLQKLADEHKRKLSDYIRFQLEKVVEDEKEKKKTAIK